MALPQQGTETFMTSNLQHNFAHVLMALPQQGTETRVYRIFHFKYLLSCVNGLTPTGDGNLLNEIGIKNIV